MSQQNERIYEFAEFRLLPEEHLLSRSGEPISLKPKAFSTLVLLVERHGHLVGKSELMERIWEDSFVEEAAVSRCIWSIRNALGEDSKNVRFIQTVPKLGYRFVAEVTEVQRSIDDEPSVKREIVSAVVNSNLLPITRPSVKRMTAALPSQERADASQERADVSFPVLDEAVETRTESDDTTAAVDGRTSRLRSKYFFIGLFAVLLLLSSVGTYYFLKRTPSPVATNGSRIAVLPLKPVYVENRDPIVEFGIAESLILKLSSDKNLTVRPLSAVRHYVALDRDPVDAGRALNVDFVLSSNYQLVNGKIRVTSQLLNVSTGQTEWTFKSESDAADAFSMQDKVANGIGNAVFARFGTAPNTFAAKRGTANEEAYRLYSQAMYLVEKEVKTDTQRSIELLDKAIALDPNYAAAWAGKGRAHCAYSHMGDRSPEEEYEIARPAVERALELDSNLAEAHAILGIIQTDYYWNFAEGEKHFLRAIELSPSADYYRWYGNRLVRFGRFEEAVAAMKTAINSSPANIFHYQMFGWVLYMARRNDEAIEQLERVVEMDPSFATAYDNLWKAYHLKGDYARAFESFLQHRQLAGASSDSMIQFNSAYQKNGWPAVLKTYQEMMKAQEPKEGFWAGNYTLAVLSAFVGDKEQSFESLNKAFKYRSAAITFLKTDPALDSLHGDPRFSQMLTRAGFSSAQ